MHYSKFHVMHNMILLLSTGRSECQCHRLNHCMCIEKQAWCQHTSFASFLLVVAFTLVGRLTPGSQQQLDCLSVAVGWLLLQYYYSYCLSDYLQWPCTKVKEAGCLHQAGRQRWVTTYFRHNMYMYILYMRCKDAIVGEQLNS